MLSEAQKDFYDLIFYQIYPRSFFDSNGDGIGDLNGITEKLDYLTELGVNAVWLSPCYKSPNDDNGYDISDYCDIMDEFGTIDDWKRMICEMHKRGIKLIMDYVPNHTSTEHKWFQNARRSKDDPYHDYYIWSDSPREVGKWRYDEAAKQYYMHTFAPTQADLNWDNPKVREELIKVIDFWTELGADGFRCDVLELISKDLDNGKNGKGPRLHEYINSIFGTKRNKNLFTVGENWGTSEKDICDFTDGRRGELSTVFQFDHITVSSIDKFTRKDGFKLDEVRDIFVRWQNFMQENELLYTLFFENHDIVRCVSRYGDEFDKRYESATMLATMLYLQKGIPFIYQGQEIGTVNSYVDDINEVDDYETIEYYNANPRKLEHEKLMDSVNFGTRDNGRHPMPWDASENSGFSLAKPWLPVYKRYKEINVKTDQGSERSVFSYYKELLALRKKSEAIRRGFYQDITNGRDGMYIYRRYNDDEEYITVCNFEKENVLDAEFNCRSVLSNKGERDFGGIYEPYECAVFKIR